MNINHPATNLLGKTATPKRQKPIVIEWKQAGKITPRSDVRYPIYYIESTILGCEFPLLRIEWNVMSTKDWSIEFMGKIRKRVPGEIHEAWRIKKIAEEFMQECMGQLKRCKLPKPNKSRSKYGFDADGIGITRNGKKIK